MTDEPEKDPAVARALERIAVPDYEPGFWDRLEARLDPQGDPAAPRHDRPGEPSP